MIRPGTEPRSSGPLANTLPTRPMSQVVGVMSRVLVNGPGDQGSIPGQVIPKTQKIVLDAALLNTRLR